MNDRKSIKFYTIVILTLIYYDSELSYLTILL